MSGETSQRLATLSYLLTPRPEARSLKPCYSAALAWQAGQMPSNCSEWPVMT